MKTEVNRADFLRVLKYVGSVLAPGGAVRFINGYITATGENQAATAKFATGVDLVVPLADLSKVLSKYKAECVSVWSEANQLRISTKRSQAGITCLEADNSDLVGFDCMAEPVAPEFLQALKVCTKTTAKDHTDPTRSSIHIEGAFVESTDNFRLTRFKMSEEMKPMLIPVQFVAKISGLEITHYGIDKTWAFFQSEEEWFVATRLIDADFPDLSQFTHIHGIELRLPPRLKDMLSRSCIFAKDSDSDLVDIRVVSGYVDIKAEGEAGWAAERSRITYDGPERKFRLNPHHLMAFVESAGTITVGDRFLSISGENCTHIICLQEV